MRWGVRSSVVVGLIIAIIKDGFNWNYLLKGAIIGALSGVGAELLSRIGGLLKTKK